MPYDGNGNFVRLHNWTADAANSLDISSSEMDAEDNGFASALTNAVTRDGQGRMSVDFLPNVDNTLNLGSGALRWASINGVQLPSANSPLAFYPRSAAEVTAGVTPTLYFYPVGDIRRYGAKGDFATDDTTAINNACLVQATGGGGIVWIDGTMRCIVNSNILVGNRVVLKGPHERPGLPLPYSTAGLQATGGAIWLASTATIELAPGTGTGTSEAGGAGVNGLYILRQGVTVATSAGNADTVVSAFAGTAVTVEGTTTVGDLTGADSYIGHCFIGGFATAISAGICDRLGIEWVSGDNTNGIYLNNTNDLARVHHCHFWNFFTYYYITDTTNAWRGTGFKLDTLAEGCQLSDCFCYGYQIGFDVQGASNVLRGCWGDAATSVVLSGSKSFNVVGNDTKLIACQASSHQYGFYLNSGGVVDMEGCSSWGAPSNCATNIYINAGYVRMQGGVIYGSAGTLPSSAFVGIASTGVGWWSIDGVTFWDVSGLNTTALSVTGAAAQVGNLGVNCIYHGVTPPSQTQDARQYSLTPPVHARYLFGATAGGLVDNFLQARGVLGNATVSQASDTIYKMNAFGTLTGGGLAPAAAIRFQVQSAPGASSMPGCIIFSVTPSGAITESDAAMINNGGNLVPVTDNAVTCGGSGQRWSAVWAANGTIQTSDARQKNVLGDVPGLDFISLLKPVRYRWKVGGNKVVRQKYHDARTGTEIPQGNAIPDDAVPGKVITESVPGKREHWGLLAQEVKSAADKLGLDFGGWIKTNPDDPESEEGLRYDQLIPSLIRAVQELLVEVTALKKGSA